MARRVFERDEGFTLIELLLVVLIIAILAAIALPAFLGQRSKGQDSSAKSDARNLASQVQACYTTTESYGDCESGDTMLEDGGMPASVTAAAVPGGYDITSVSRSGNTFFIERRNGDLTRSCSDAGTTKGGCEGSSW